MDKKRIIEVLQTIADDMEADARDFDEQPFNGKTVAKALGYHGAAIAGLSNIIRNILEAEGSE